MKKAGLLITTMIMAIVSMASDKDTTHRYVLPDSIKVIQFMAEIRIDALSGKKEMAAGIQTDIVRLYVEAEKNEREIEFEFPKTAVVAASGIGTETEKDEITFGYDWSLNETYKLMISMAADSADNFSLYSGYIFLPKENKWKLIGTCRIKERWNTLQNPTLFHSKGVRANWGESWCQRQNGTWKNMNNATAQVPVINLYNHQDSLQQSINEVKYITDKITATNSPLSEMKVTNQGIFYTIMKEGTGRRVSVEDTVVAYYKGYLFSNDMVFDQTKDKPATFPLKRLIKGWQLGLPHCNVGGKIKLVIPSGLAYSIRTRAAKIPPNSILVFEIEVLEAKN